MFDIGLSELMLIGVVALVVIGPERLPKVARTAGLLLGRLQRYVSDVKSDISREIQLDEMKKLQQQVTDQVKGLEASVSHEMREVESSVTSVVAPLVSDGAAPSAPTVEASPAAVAPTTQALAPGASAEMPKS